MEILDSHKIKIKYEGGLADDNSLPGYSGAASIDGITRAIHIVTHAYMTGEVVSRATALKGASIIIKPPQRGSFVFDLIVLMEKYPATTGSIASIASAPFYDFLKVAFKWAVGEGDAEIENTHLKRLYDRKEPPKLKRPMADLDLLAETLEGSLYDAHRPIGDEGTIDTISIGSSRKNLIIFDSETKDWVSTQEEDSKIKNLSGSVTRYNSISKNGRIYIDQLNKVVAFRPKETFPHSQFRNLTWSLHGSTVGSINKINIEASFVKSASGKIKRILLSECKPI